MDEELAKRAKPPTLPVQINPRRKAVPLNSPGSSYSERLAESRMAKSMEKSYENMANSLEKLKFNQPVAPQAPVVPPKQPKPTPVAKEEKPKPIKTKVPTLVI